MDLDRLAEVITRERMNFEEKIRSLGRGLVLQDVTKHIHFDPRTTEYAEFKEGQFFNFSLCQGRFNIGVGARTNIFPCRFYENCKF
jgi:hypothetical protein